MTVAVSEELSHEEVKRYSRHLIMPEVGMGGAKETKAGQRPVCGCGRFGFTFSFLSGSCRSRENGDC